MAINRNPYFLSEEEEQRGYRAIARISLFWGPVELLIEGMIVHLRNLHGETDQSFPVSFSRKTDELKDRLKREPQLADFRERLTPRVGRSKELHIMRTHIVHSYFQGQNLDGLLMFGRSNQKQGVAYTEARYAIANIEAATTELLDLHDALAPLWQELLDFVLPEIRRRNIARISRASGKADQ